MKKNGLKILGICMIGLLVACSNSDTEDDEKDTIVPVETTQVKEDELVIEKTLSGRTAPNQTTPVIIEMPGEVVEIHAENGDTVEEDDVLITLETQAGNQDIKAPKTGEIAQLDLSEGDVATDADPIAIIIDMEKMKVNYTVTHQMRSLLKKEMQLDTTAEDESYKAEITTVGSIPGETTLYPVEAIIDNDEDKLIPGMIVKSFVPEKRLEKALIVPTASIVEESDGAFVYLIEDDEAVKVEITITESQSDVTAIEGNVHVDDEVVMNGRLTLSDGSKVEVVEEGNQS